MTPHSPPAGKIDDETGDPGGRSGLAGRLDEQLCFALYAATNAVIRAYRPLLKDLGLTYPQYLVMLVLWEHRTRRLGEIAATLRLATHAISPIVDRLEDAGLVRRVGDERDGRVVHVELTPTGAGLEPDAAAVQEEIRCQSGLEMDDVLRLRAELLGLVDQMTDVGPPQLTKPAQDGPLGSNA